MPPAPWLLLVLPPGRLCILDLRCLILFSPLPTSALSPVGKQGVPACCSHIAPAWRRQDLRPDLWCSPYWPTHLPVRCSERTVTGASLPVTSATRKLQM